MVDQIQSKNQTFILLADRVQISEDRLAKNSKNSGKPPLTDGYSKPTLKSLRKRHQKKAGGKRVIQVIRQSGRKSRYYEIAQGT